MSGLKLTPQLRAMLERVKDATDRNGSLMLLLITASGRPEARKLEKLIAAEWVELCDHVLPRGPVDGARITVTGRKALSP